MTGPGQVFRRTAKLHQNRDLVDHLADILAHEMRSEHAVGFDIGQNLDEPVGRQHRLCPSIGGERELADLVVDAGLLELFLGLAD